MNDLFSRVINNLFDRVDGPMEIRLLVQPIMAAIFAFRDGLQDFRQNRAPYGWSLISEPRHRGRRLRDGWRSIRKVFFAALAIDVVYQLVELKWVYLGEALILSRNRQVDQRMAT
jgi:hypothetical protein